MSRLIVFGCSHTFGYGLDDCLNDTSKPSNLGWSNIIAKQLNRQLVNKSYPGASNKFIWHQIKNTKFRKDDVVIILWSYMTRNTVLLGPNKVLHLMNTQTEQVPAADAYFRYLHSRYDAKQMTKLFINDASSYLKEQSVQYYQMICNQYDKGVFGNNQHLDIYLDNYRTVYPKASDNVHMGIDGNIKFASDIITLMGYESTLPDVDKLPLLMRIRNYFLVRMGVNF